MTLPDDIAIQAVALAKKYRIFDSPRQRLKEALDPWGRSFHQDFWALRDIDLTIRKGHTVGILGRNGSGKSTLLQLITEVMQPTSGTVAVAGRVTALLELGAGFDPDFTGRENAVQFGRLQGLSAREIEQRLPDIEAFAGIGDFFDREVKTYSSGMFARLAFAAAINVDPDVLILDEILAVGDARFQQRCYSRLRDLQDAGKTVLMVSHSLEAIIDHCDSAILLDKGRLIATGAPKEVADRYREIMFDEVASALGEVPAARPTRTASAEPLTDTAGVPALAAEMLADVETGDRFPRRPGYNDQETSSGSGEAEILDYRIEVDGEAVTSTLFDSGQVVRVFLLGRSERWHENAEVGLSIRRVDGFFVYGSHSVMRPEAFERWSNGHAIVFAIRFRLNLQSGHYFIDAGLFRKVGEEPVILRIRRNSIQLTVVNTPHFDGLVDLVVSKTVPNK
jgi:lipopolysaccharide transport system ATP-binding protein